MPDARFYQNEAFNPKRRVGRGSEVDALLKKSRSMEETIATSTRPDIFKQGGLLSGWQDNIDVVEDVERDFPIRLTLRSLEQHANYSGNPYRSRFTGSQVDGDSYDSEEVDEDAGIPSDNLGFDTRWGTTPANLDALNYQADVTGSREVKHTWHDRVTIAPTSRSERMQEDPEYRVRTLRASHPLEPMHVEDD